MRAEEAKYVRCQVEVGLARVVDSKHKSRRSMKKAA